MENAGQYLDRAAAEAGHKTALIFQERILTYHELADRVDVLAVSLVELGVKHADRVVVLMPNCPDLIIASQAILKIGAIKVPFYINILEEDLIGGLKYCEAKAIIMTSEWKGHSFARTLDNVRNEFSNLRYVIVSGKTFPDMIPLNQLVNHEMDRKHVLETYLRENPVGANDLACVGYSRGIGTINNTIHTHQSILAHYSNDVIKVNEDDIWLGMVPLCSSLGFQCVEPCVVAGKATLILMESFDVQRVFSMIAKYKVTALVGAPTQFSVLIASPHLDEPEIFSLRQIYLGGAVAPKSLMKRIEEKFNCQTTVIGPS